MPHHRSRGAPCTNCTGVFSLRSKYHDEGRWWIKATDAYLTPDRTMLDRSPAKPSSIYRNFFLKEQRFRKPWTLKNDRLYLRVHKFHDLAIHTYHDYLLEAVGTIDIGTGFAVFHFGF